MIPYIIRRLLLGTVVIWMVSVTVFFLMNVLPGDPAVAQLGLRADPAVLEKFRELHGLDRPLVVRYADWLGGIVRLDLGTSYANDYPVAQLLKERLKPTAELGLFGLVITLFVGVPAGVIAALNRNSPIDVAANLFAVMGAAIPGFFLGLLLILLLAVHLRLLPVSGFVPFSEDPAENLKRMVMPAITLGVGSAALVMRQTRSAMLEVLNKDYIRTAKAKGLQQRVVIRRHALRNAFIPILTVLGFQVGVIFGGAVITESIFNIPGMGRLIVDSIQISRDYTTVQTIAFFGAIVMVLINLIVDVSYAFVDPRIRYGKA